jgi:hypothetical protein
MWGKCPHEAIRQLAEARARLATAEGALTEAEAALKQAEARVRRGGWAGGRGRRRPAHRLCRSEVARPERYAARQAHERAGALVERLQRRVGELTGRLSRMTLCRDMTRN